jgi:hypothetical protein
MKRQTIFSPCRKYRYTLWREWWNDFWFDDIEPGEACAGNQFKYVQFIGLNPSTADETKDDHTIRRCRAFAKSWGYGAMCMTNLFAWRETDSKLLPAVAHPIGAENDKWLQEIAKGAGVVVAAWGTKGDLLNRCQHVSTLVSNLFCLRKTAEGFPEHPLYLPKTLTPIPL